MDSQLSAEQIAVQVAASKLFSTYDDLLVAPDESGLWADLVDFGVGAEWGEPDSLGMVELALLAREMGASLATAPLAEGAALSVLGRTEINPLVQDLLADRKPVTLAVLEPGRSWDAPCATQLTSNGLGFSLTGVKTFVLHGSAARHLLVVASLDGAETIAVVASDEAGVRLESQSSFERRMNVSRVHFDSVRVPMGNVVHNSASDVVAAVRQLATVLTAAESNGAAGRLARMATEYSRDREQFGRPIGSFQAIAHLLAETHVLVESTWSSVLHAAATMDDLSAASDAKTRAASIAKAYASDAGRETAHIAMQVFGGIAFTAEHPAHHHLRRALVCGEAYGDSRHHELRLGESLLAAVGTTS